jgi:pimeloyl-ACP methyl ester carboxylesterase
MDRLRLFEVNVPNCCRKSLSDLSRGTPLLYLRGFADVHSVKESWLPFHQRLAERARVIAPAHPGCARSDENQDIDAIEDVVFHNLEAAPRRWSFFLTA